MTKCCATLNAVDDFVIAFEEAAQLGHADLADFLPDKDDPLYSRVLRELVRIDMEFAWDRGQRRRIDDYSRRFPMILRDAEVLQDIAYEEFRQRLVHGENPVPSEYSSRFGVDTNDWNHPISQQLADSERTVVTAGLAEAGVAIAAMNRIDPKREQSSSNLSLGGDSECDGDLQPKDIVMPAPGSDFLGFHIIDELGRGAFGRVFLARQTGLADRPVALKLSTDLRHESHALAQLQHTNIVPIYSVHQVGEVQAICMPYYGATTLVDVMLSLRKTNLLPASGRHFVSTLNDRKSRTRTSLSQSSHLSTNSNVTASNLPAPQSSIELPQQRSHCAILDKLEGQTYIDAVLWIVARLADGIAHAHDRGIIHRDLKPANVLLTDEGQPMLLDFNLSAGATTLTNPAAARLGGTLPYMSPEQIEAFQGKQTPLDSRTDIYSLGLIFLELLTSRHPYPTPTGPIRSSLAVMAEQRRQLPANIRELNPAITPAVEAIVLKCLANSPAQRYRTAHELVEDIECQLANLPLRHAHEPSLAERARKWTRRHPRLTSSTTVAAIAAVVFASVGIGALVGWNRHVASLAIAQKQHDRLAAEKQSSGLQQSARLQLGLINDSDSQSLTRIADISRNSLSPYEVLDNPTWQQLPHFVNLQPEQQAALRESIGAMLVRWADAELRHTRNSSDKLAGLSHLTLAWKLNEAAERAYADQAAPKSLWTQRAELAGLLGRDDVTAIRQQADAMTPKSAADYFDLGRELVQQREFLKAIPQFREATRLDPKHFWAWHYLGNCYYESLQFPKAIDCYSTCAGLAPDPSVAYFPYYHRALVEMRQGLFAAGSTDITQAIAALADLPEHLASSERPRAHLLWAKALTARKDLVGAEKVLTDALTVDANHTEMLVERSRVRQLRKDSRGAREDLEAVIRNVPTSEVGWNHRGLARAAKDPRGALTDFEEALKLNPRFQPALQNKASVLADMGKAEESLAVLNRTIELYPGYVRARIGRGVLLARQNRRDEAHADVRESLARDRNAETLYQAANIYALTSQNHPADADNVIPLLAAALWNGFGLDLVDTDSDFDAVRNQPAFQRLVATVRDLQSSPNKRNN